MNRLVLGITLLVAAVEIINAGHIGHSGYAGGYANAGGVGGVNGGQLNSRPPSVGGAQGQVLRFVSVHVPPKQLDTPPPSGPRVVHAGGPKDTHYNIIFVRAPNPPPQRQTEVILPSPPERKTIVYVLVSKPQQLTDEQAVKFVHPKPTTNPKPEVFFVSYKGQGQGQSGDAYGPPGPAQIPSVSYGSPAPETPSASYGGTATSSFSVPAVSGGYSTLGGYQRRSDDEVETELVEESVDKKSEE